MCQHGQLSDLRMFMFSVKSLKFKVWRWIRALKSEGHLSKLRLPMYWVLVSGKYTEVVIGIMIFCIIDSYLLTLDWLFSVCLLTIGETKAEARGARTATSPTKT